MSHIPRLEESVAPKVAVAGVLLTAIAELRRLDLPRPTAGDALAALGVGRSQAYVAKERLQVHLPELIAAVGRPNKTRREAEAPELATKVLTYLYEHPGAVSGSGSRRRYDRGFRLFVLDLLEEHPDVDRETFARTIDVPLPTLKDWLRVGQVDVDTPADEEEQGWSVGSGQIATVLHEYERWSGGFVPFCEHVQEHLHLPLGRTAIDTILKAHGLREPSPRPGRSPDESALRGAFETFFPNAQWVGDGTALAITLNGERYVFNLELVTDAFTGAFVGADVRPTEDAQALIGAVDDASTAVDDTPLALLLDNKPSNHAPEVEHAVAPTTIIRATSARPQNKAHVEGGFGLLKANIDELEITAHTAQEFACVVLTVMVMAWGRTINHRPRRDRRGRSRAQLLTDKPSAEQIEHARMKLAELQRRQERARRTLAARQDPVVRAFISEALERLCLEDPQGHFLNAIARYPLDAVVEAVAVFEGRLHATSLPDHADARYLLGISRNIAQDREAWQIAHALWRARERAGDMLLTHLSAQRDVIIANNELPDDRQAALIDQALDASWLGERLFWLNSCASLIRASAPECQRRCFTQAARRIQASYHLPNRERQAAIRMLAARLLPLR